MPSGTSSAGSGAQSAMASAQPIAQPSHRGAPVAISAQQAVSPPSKEQLKSWWTKFGRRKDKPEEQGKRTQLLDWLQPLEPHD